MPPRPPPRQDPPRLGARTRSGTLPGIRPAGDGNPTASNDDPGAKRSDAAATAETHANEPPATEAKAGATEGQGAPIIDDPSTQDVTASMVIDLDAEGSVVRERRPNRPIAPAPPANRHRYGRRSAAELRAGEPLRASFTHYELLMPVAKGGMAWVWAAHVRGGAGFRRVVAVKTLLPELSDHPDFRAMFLDEARISARIQHPNIAPVLDFGDESGLLYLVMEWIEGDSLAALRKAARPFGGIPHPISLRIISDVCLGLHAAHELRDENGQLLDLVHRDVSPSNVVVAHQGFVKLVDFGIAKSKARTYVTAHGALKGKASYLSPEQVQGRPLDRRSDIFAIGTMLYSLTTGRHPFRAKDEIRTATNIINVRPPSPRTLVPSMSPALEAVIYRALEKDPDRRFSTALELHEALREVLVTMGKPPTSTDVAAVVHKLAGEKIERRVAQLRAMIAAFEEAERIRQGASVTSFGAARAALAKGSGTDELWLADEDEITPALPLTEPPPGARTPSQPAPPIAIAPMPAPSAPLRELAGATGSTPPPANPFGAADDVEGVRVSDGAAFIADPSIDAPEFAALFSRERRRRRAAVGIIAAVLIGGGLALLIPMQDDSASKQAPAVTQAAPAAMPPPTTAEPPPPLPPAEPPAPPPTAEPARAAAPAETSAPATGRTNRVRSQPPARPATPPSIFRRPTQSDPRRYDPTDI